jgi:NADPH:quinone reductase-like Zn-dependent oxidoreductase
LRAVIFDRYGPPEVLRVAEVERPTPKPDELLIRVHATTATRSDCGRRSAEYFVGRLFTGFFRPRTGTIGIEFAGEVERVGDDVSQFAVGAHVFGIAGATNAEYICVKESAEVATMLDGMTFEEAAAAPDGALSAMSLLRGRLDKGDRILVYGASGSIGVGAVQIAKHFGAHVTAVCNTPNIDVMRNPRRRRVVLTVS